MRRCWLALLVGSVFVANPAAVSACSCVPFTKPQLVANASAIFTGTVTDAGRSVPLSFGCSPNTIHTSGPISVTLTVETIYRGDAPRSVTLTTQDNEASCGYAFQTGKRYTVFATGAVDKPETNLCRGNVEGAISPAEYGLGAGRPPG